MYTVVSQHRHIYSLYIIIYNHSADTNKQYESDWFSSTVWSRLLMDYRLDREICQQKTKEIRKKERW